MAKNAAPQTLTCAERRRVLVAAADSVRSAYWALRGPASFRTWEVLEADSFERAHFALQMDACDVLLLDGSLYQSGDDGLAWLLGQHSLPTLLVADAAAAVTGLYEGAHQWLPADVARDDPALLSATLGKLAHLGDSERRACVSTEALQDTRRQVSRLVSLLWEVTPNTSGTRWFTQRHMMERLYQEASRCERHGGNLSVVLGQIRSLARPRLSPEESHALASWTAERLSTSKRRCDVAGQYGPHGFLLLLQGSTKSGAVVCCKRIQDLLEVTEAPIPQLQVYFGIAAFSSATTTVKTLLSRAEQHLSEALHGNGERVVA